MADGPMRWIYGIEVDLFPPYLSLKFAYLSDIIYTEFVENLAKLVYLPPRTQRTADPNPQPHHDHEQTIAELPSSSCTDIV